MSTIGISSSGNTLTVNGKTANAVNSVSGSVSGNTLDIDVNGVSGQVALPISSKELVTSGDVSQFFTASNSSITVVKEFEIEYIKAEHNSIDISTSTIYPGVYTGLDEYDAVSIGNTYTSSYWGIIIRATSSLMYSVLVNGKEAMVRYAPVFPYQDGWYYRLYA